MKYLSILIILFSITASTYGQFVRADHKKAAQLKQRPLIVALFDMEEEAGTYCDSIHMAWYNDNIKEIFLQHWTLNDSIIFMRSKRVASILASKSSDYAIFSVGPSREGQQSSGDIFWFPSFTFMLYLSEDGKKFDSRMVDRGLYSEPLVPDMEMTGQLFRGKYIYKLSMADLSISENDIVFILNNFNTSIKNSLLEKRAKGGLYSEPLVPDMEMTGQLFRGKYIYKLSMADLSISEYDIVFILNNFNTSIKNSLSEKKAKGGIYAQKIPKEITARLKNMTLLIPDNLDPDGVDEKKVDKYYKYSFRISSQEEISEAIASNAANTAYLHYLWSDHERMFQGLIINAESHEVLAVFRPGAISIQSEDCSPVGTSYRNRISMNVKRLKSLK